MSRRTWVALLLLSALLYLGRDEVFAVQRLIHEEEVDMPAQPASVAALAEAREDAAAYGDAFEIHETTRLRVRLQHDGEGWATGEVTLVDVDTDVADTRSLAMPRGTPVADAVFEAVPAGRYRMHVEPSWEPMIAVVPGPPGETPAARPPSVYLEIYDAPERPWRFGIAAALLLLPWLLAAPATEA